MGGNICVFPEGTTLNDRYLITFRSGAFVSGQPVYPVCIRYPFTWTSPRFGESTIPTILKLTSCLYWRMEIIHLPVYHPSSEEQANPKVYASNVRREISLAMNDPPVRLSDLSNEECLDYWQRYGAEHRPASELLTASEITLYGSQSPHLMVPTALAKKQARNLVTPMLPSPDP